MGLDVELDPRLRERSFGEWEGMTQSEEICEHYADDYQFLARPTRKGEGETKHGKGKPHPYGPTRRGSCRATSSPNTMTRQCLPHCFSSATAHRIVATVAVLLDMDPDDLNNVGAMRNAFWTRMTPHTDPRNADRPTLEA